MLLIGLFVIGCALPLAMSSPRLLALCALAAAAIFSAALISTDAAEAGSVIGVVGVISAGLLVGAVVRAVLLWNDQAQDRAIRRDLPRELPPRYR